MTDQRKLYSAMMRNPPIEADGVNVIECGAIDVDQTSDYFKLVNATGGYGFDLRKLASPARYRVLLERIE